ncbi:hypothetical protein QM480_04825 [Flectobacillus sp. DC10W]|jgi:hypothetical protein|uniref:Uncharacterized protein n=1 Tax=Flectobacillus longus TaxID=2984207 RepID=A0ABT6YJM3_9BACT|nr:hypothetical protein [Flectobacillus longus]MDI9863634.1 hypothetical protein [Flectobacillus longus]
MNTLLKTGALLSVLFMASCKQKAQDQQTTIDSTIAQVKVDSTNMFPKETDYKIKVQMSGTFHEGQVPLDSDKKSWMGIFQTERGIELKKTSISLEKVHDEIIDEQPEAKTGIQINIPQKDICLLLIEAQPYLEDHVIAPLTLPRIEFYPNDVAEFEYLGVKYKLFAVGKKEVSKDDPNQILVTDYTLTISFTKDGKDYNNVLIRQPHFDSKIPTIQFAGDIDGDGILDLMLDAATYYNDINSTLYLSKIATGMQGLTIAGGFTASVD